MAQSLHSLTILGLAHYTLPPSSELTKLGYFRLLAIANHLVIKPYS